MDKEAKLNNKLKNRSKRLNDNEYLYRGYTIEKRHNLRGGVSFCRILNKSAYCAKAKSLKVAKQMIDHAITGLENKSN